MDGSEEQTRSPAHRRLSQMARMTRKCTTINKQPVAFNNLGISDRFVTISAINWMIMIVSTVIDQCSVHSSMELRAPPKWIIDCEQREFRGLTRFLLDVWTVIFKPRSYTGKCRMSTKSKTSTPKIAEYYNILKPENSVDKPYPLTEDEALHFIETKLHISEPRDCFRRDKLKLLHRLVERLNKNVPFTNMHTFLKVPISEINEDTLKEDMVRGEGGPCTWINPFAKALLERLGYRVHHICGYNPGEMLHDSHIGIIVHDAAHPGSVHLFEAGTRRPLNAAIPLDFEHESPEYRFHYMTSKFFRDGNRLVWCARSPGLKINGKYTMYDSSGQPWKQQLTYCLDEERNWYPFVRISQKLYTLAKDALTPPFNGLVFWAYLNEDQIISVLAFQKEIVTYLYDQDGSLKQMNLSKAELLRFFQENFPQYSDEKLREVFTICPFQ